MKNKARITLYNDDKTVSFTIDLDEQKEYYDESDGPYRTTFEDWVKDIDINDRQLDTINGNHCLFGELEAFFQSDEYPRMFLWGETLRYKFKKLV